MGFNPAIMPKTTFVDLINKPRDMDRMDDMPSNAEYEINKAKAWVDKLLTPATKHDTMRRDYNSIHEGIKRIIEYKIKYSLRWYHFGFRKRMRLNYLSSLNFTEALLEKRLEQLRIEIKDNQNEMRKYLPKTIG